MRDTKPPKADSFTLSSCPFKFHFFPLPQLHHLEFQLLRKDALLACYILLIQGVSRANVNNVVPVWSCVNNLQGCNLLQDTNIIY